MLIECIIRRPDGTDVDMARENEPIRAYRFAPQVPGGPHVCEVGDADDIARFLAIPEGYRRRETMSDAEPPKPKRAARHDAA